MRTTRTDIDSMAEGQIEDVWGLNSREEDELTESWTGRTIFTILKPRPAKRTDEWIAGRLTRRTEGSTRTPRIWPEVWHSWGPAKQKAEIEAWKIEGPKRARARAALGIDNVINEIAYVKAEEVEEYKGFIRVANEERGIDVAPMMPVVEIPQDLAGIHTSARESSHEESIDDPSMSARESSQKNISNVQDAGGEAADAEAFAGYARLDDETNYGGSCNFASEIKGQSTREHQDHFNHSAVEQYIMVHTPIPIGKALQIPDAVKALDAEWEKLETKLKSWDKNAPKEKAQVIKEAKAKGEQVHFATLEQLCHQKNSQLEESMRKYKGRIVLRGDNVKDQEGFYAVFSEQGTSASQMSAAKFLDAIARCPGCKGEDSDAVGAYTQVILKDMAKVKGVEHITTWITLPRNRRPSWWNKFEEPVVELKRNLYGHPLAGLFWEKHCQIALYKLGWEKVPSWECLFVHRKQKLFLSVYVDDFKMAGKADNMPKMWKQMSGLLDLEPPVPIEGNVYLGMAQEKVTPDPTLVKEKREVYNTLIDNGLATPNKCKQKLECGLSAVDAFEQVEHRQCTERGVKDLCKEKDKAKDFQERDGRPDKSARESARSEHAIKAWEYKMTGHTRQQSTSICSLPTRV